MRLSSATAYKQIGSLAVIAVLLWLGGFGCSLCCATGATDSCCLRNHPAAATSCGAGATRSCCKPQKARGRAAVTDVAIEGEGTPGCSLLPNQAEGVTVQVKADDAHAPNGEPPAPLFTSYSSGRAGTLREAPSPLNRGGTYLRYGVLLI